MVKVTHHLTIAPFRLGDLKNGDRFCVTPDPYFRAEYIKTNMFEGFSGEWYCCNLVDGRMDIFPLDQVVYTKREVK